MRTRRRRFTYLTNFAAFSLLPPLLGALLFLIMTVTAGSLSKAASSLRINIEGFTERDRSPILLECFKGFVRSLDGKHTFSEEVENTALKARKWNGTPFTDFLETTTKDGGGEYVLFLVRPEGIATFHLLRDILVLRNDDLCTSSVQIANSRFRPDGLTKELKDKLHFEGGKLSFLGRMSSNERETLFQFDPQARTELNALFDRAQHSATCVDHGSELLPSEWKLQKDDSGQVQVLPGNRPQ